MIVINILNKQIIINKFIEPKNCLITGYGAAGTCQQASQKPHKGSVAG